MKVWKDIVSGDEMISDSYAMKLTYDDVILEVKSRLVTKKANEDFGVSNNGKSLVSSLTSDCEDTTTIAVLLIE